MAEERPSLEDILNHPWLTLYLADQGQEDNSLTPPSPLSPTNTIIPSLSSPLKSSVESTPPLSDIKASSGSCSSGSNRNKKPRLVQGLVPSTGWCCWAVRDQIL
jgi:hypothetical protein